MYTISWNEHEQRLDSPDEIDRLLDNLHKCFSSGDPTLVTVEREDTGDSLSIGLGRDMSVLNYVRGDKDPPYYTSTGGSDGDEAISFRFGGEWSEYSLRNAIPLSIARSAMRQFCETGELTKNIEWEEV